MSKKLQTLALWSCLAIAMSAHGIDLAKQTIADHPSQKIRPAKPEDQSLTKDSATAQTQPSQSAAPASAIIVPATTNIQMMQLPSGILMSKYEVTRAQFAAFVADTGYSAGASCWTKEKGEWGEHDGHNWQNPGLIQDNNHPVVCVNFSDAEAYIHWLNSKTGKRYRLPSQDEWYGACLAGSYDSEYCGSNNINAVGWYEGNSGGSTHSVGLRQPNAYGLHDMSGNVWEWTSTCYETDCTRRVARGGSWGNEAGYSRAEALNWNDTPVRYDLLGFRLVEEP